jgi:CRP/FNR family transcriptional regulator, cyclic AMP receptor protein
MKLQNDTVQYFLEDEFFQDLDQNEFMRLEQTATPLVYEPGQIIYDPGDSREVLFILKQGAVELYRLRSDGQKVEQSTLKEGTVFGEMTLLGQAMRNRAAETLSPSTILEMSRADVEDLLRQNPQMALRFLRILGERLRAVEQQLERLPYTGVASELAAHLLELASMQGEIIGYSREELGEMVGTTREAAASILDEFREQGLIDIEPGHIHILDHDILLSIADAG